MIGDFSYEIRYYWGGLTYPSDKYLNFTASFYVEPIQNDECEHEAFVNAESGTFRLNQIFNGDLEGYEVTAVPDNESSLLFDNSNTLLIDQS